MEKQSIQKTSRAGRRGTQWKIKTIEGSGPWTKESSFCRGIETLEESQGALGERSGEREKGEDYTDIVIVCLEFTIVWRMIFLQGGQGPWESLGKKDQEEKTKNRERIKVTVMVNL